MSVRSWARGWSSPRTAAALLAVVLALALAGLRATVRVRAADPPDYQGACSAGEPWFATACYYGLTRSDKTGMVYEPRAASVVLFADTPNDGPHRVAATIEQVGTVWGLAYRSREQALYAAAYHKVQLPFGPAGPGAVYRIDLATGQVRPFLTVPNVGPDRHERTIRFDPGAESWTSRTGLGDLDLSPDESELVVANLDDRRIYRFAMPDGSFLGSFANGAAGEPWSAEARAFGLAHDGTFVYHAVVRSAEVSGRETDLALHVYRSLPDGSAMAEVAAVSLDGPRGNLKGISRTVDLAWQPWRDGQRGVSAGYPFIYDLSLYPMPLATDIVLAAGSSMVVGLRDRRSDSRRFFDRSPDLSLGLDVGLGIGDLLYASFNGRTWDFDTGDEHFDDQVLHVSDESALGGLAGFDRGRRVVAGSYLLDTDPGFVRLFEGAYWYETATGQRVQHEALCDPARLNPLARLRLVETVYAHDGPGGPFSGELRAPGSVGDVEVLCARDAVPTSTATVTDAPTSPPRDPTPPTPTPTSSPTASSPPPPTPPSPTRTRTPTETPTRAPTPTPRALYLPIALRERCPVDKQHVDVALVIDASTSMRDDRTATGRTKLEAALEAATAFVGALGLPLDQAAVVGFNSDAWVEHPLTGRRSDVEAALARIPDGVREQTRIDLGIAEAHRELLCPRRLTGNRPAMIVLTDGLANPEPASTAVRRAAEAKADGITIFTIGLGHEGELNVPELTQMATRPDYFYHAPDAEDLAALYQAIAVELPCPGVRLWGRR